MTSGLLAGPAVDEATAAPSPRATSTTFIHRDPSMRAVMAHARRAATAEATLLIDGESGTGKEVMARVIHQMSHRANGPFIGLNCAAVPEGLLESELFGHERGAFTGATGVRAGRFERASGGTLLLDEIGDMPIGLQVKLLRVLEERAAERVGGTRRIAFDVRILATTNRCLEEQVQKGQFRLDLFYRLNVVRLTLPPLRERPLDIEPLARAFLPAGRELDDSAIAALVRHSWVGNVRELQNVIERAVILGDGEIISADDLALGGPGPMQGQVVPRGTLEEVEQLCILAALEDCAGNRTRTAELLGISIRTLRNRLADYRRAGIAIPEPRSSND